MSLETVCCKQAARWPVEREKILKGFCSECGLRSSFEAERVITAIIEGYLRQTRSTPTQNKGGTPETETTS